MTNKVTISLLDKIQDAFNRHDVDAILSYFDEDCEWIMARGPNSPNGRRCVGKTEIGSVLKKRYTKIPNMRWEEIQHWVFSDTKALSEWVVKGTVISQDSFAMLGCDLWEFQNGLVTKKDTYWKYIED